MTATDTTEQEPITVKVSAQNPRTPRPATTGSKAVPAGPTLIAGANLATIAGATLFAAAGPVGLAAGAAAVGVAGAATMLGKHARAAKQQRISDRATKTSGGGTGGKGTTGSGRSGGISGVGPGRKTSTGAAGGRHSAGSTGTGSGRGGRGLLGKTSGDGKPGKLSRSLRNRQAKAAQKLAGTRTGRALSAATEGARRALRNNSTKPRTTSGAKSSGKGGKGTPLLSRPGWGVPHTVKKARKAWRKWHRGKSSNDKTKAETTTTGPDTNKPNTVGTTVRGATPGKTNKPADAPDPVGGTTATSGGANPATAGGTVTTTPMQQMQALADEILKIAEKMDSDATMEVLKWYAQWPGVLGTLDKAWRVMHDKAAENYPFHTSIIELIDAVARNQAATTKAAEVIAPTINRMYRNSIEGLYDKKNAMWDQSANRGHI